jgi:Na+/melibiose symporter-like transporter
VIYFHKGKKKKKTIMAGTLGEAIETSLRNFAVYAFSLLAALSLHESISRSVEDRKKASLFSLWMVSLAIIVVSIAIIVFVVWMDERD